MKTKNPGGRRGELLIKITPLREQILETEGDEEVEEDEPRRRGKSLDETPIYNVEESGLSLRPLLAILTFFICGFNLVSAFRASIIIRSLGGGDFTGIVQTIQFLQ